MANFEVFDQDNYVITEGVVLDTTEDPVVERDGYRTVEEQVRSFLEAGERLDEYRRGYDYDAENQNADSTELSPLELVNADVADYSQAANRVARERENAGRESNKAGGDKKDIAGIDNKAVDGNIVNDDKGKKE